jgi:tetratricopeptide (TPR) repeat protein
MSDAVKKARIDQLLLKAYQTEDPTEKIQLYDEVITLDPSNATARSEIDKALAESRRRVEDRQKTETKQLLLQNATNAIAADDEAALTKALGDLDEAVKVNPADKELSDAARRVKAKLDGRKVGQQVQMAIDAGHAAYVAESSAQLVPALRMLDEALKVDPKNPQLQNYKQKIETRLRNERLLWWLKAILLITAIVGVVAISLYLLLRKRHGMLEFADGDRTGETLSLDKPAFKIGAVSEGNDLVVTDRKGRISRYHCEIIREGKRFFVKDSSTNGTWINEVCLETDRPKLLRKGDRVSLAGEVTLIFRLK